MCIVSCTRKKRSKVLVFGSNTWFFKRMYINECLINQTQSQWAIWYTQYRNHIHRKKSERNNIARLVELFRILFHVRLVYSLGYILFSVRLASLFIIHSGKAIKNYYRCGYLFGRYCVLHHFQLYSNHTQLPVVQKDYPWMNTEHEENIRQVFGCCCSFEHIFFGFFFFFFFSPLRLWMDGVGWCSFFCSPLCCYTLQLTIDVHDEINTHPLHTFIGYADCYLFYARTSILLLVFGLNSRSNRY